MVSFLDRREAGERLAAILPEYVNQPLGVVVGLPRGGVVTAFAVAKQLHLPLDIVCPRKVGAPGNPEFAIGAVTETGEGYFDEEIIERMNIPHSYLAMQIEQEKAESQRRLTLYKKGLPPSDFQDKIVILVDDGIATGATMQAAIKSVRAQGAGKVVVAVPVIPPDTISEIERRADELRYVAAPMHFFAVGQFYRTFNPTSDAEVIELLHQSYQLA